VSGAVHEPVTTAHAMPAPDFLAADAARVDAALAEISATLLGDVAPQRREAVGYALATRGKRLRPVLCLAAYRAIAGEPGDAVVRVACALEVVHTYSLVHDDLPCMDDDDVRRGRPTVHRAFDAPLAVLAGAALIPLAIQVLEAGGAALGLDAAERARLVEALCTAAGAGGMAGGQLLDLEGGAQPLDRTQLEAIHRAKTGALLAASLRLGGLAARASEAELAALGAYGEAVGLAFQIADDILDVVGESAALGKAAGRDARLGKATYPSLFGLDGARALARARADEAVAALGAAGLVSPELAALAAYIVERGA
jgi:geranylgeranyl pyrophosphate synthase